MIAFPNAKINIGLNIVSKRKDGYHNIETVFFPIDYSDILEVMEVETEAIEPKRKSKKEPVLNPIEFNQTGIKIPGKPEENSCFKAYRLLENDYELPPIAMHLHKIIPTGAGLGGGSADGAFILKLLNNLFNIGLSDKELEKYAGKLGSDCPVFIQNIPVYANGRGELLDPIKVDLADHHLVLITPPIHVSTAEAYAKVTPYEPGYSLKDVIKQPVESWKKKIKNDFELTIFKKYPAIGAIKKELYAKGAIYASMSGSGSTVYGIFRKHEVWKTSFKTCKVHWVAL
ncbi:MAG: 4-(cytidine 5'-diphospho)-2-C-methyl-D-erythritol kinase [Bacteroidota bacterium]